MRATLQLIISLIAGPLGLALPKPLVPICGHPAIAYGLRAAARR